MADFSNWDDATRRRVEVDLVCPKCTYANQIGKLLIELARDWTAYCNACGHVWAVPRRPRED